MDSNTIFFPFAHTLRFLHRKVWTIKGAVAGEKWAIEKVIAYYDDYMTELATVKEQQPDGSVRTYVDEDLKKEIALKLLKEGYFSLIGGYKTPFINPMTRIYQNNASFEDVLALYQFDLSLRELVFQYLCQIECKIRQLVSYSFCSKHGEQQSAYLNPNNYNSSRKNASDIAYLIQLLTYHATRNKEHKYLVHQRNVYHNVPLWVPVNALTYGQISKFYALLPSRCRAISARNFQA